jgi:hypothetical protein
VHDSSPSPPVINRTSNLPCRISGLLCCNNTLVDIVTFVTFPP